MEDFPLISSVSPLLVDSLVKDYDQITYNVNTIYVLNEKKIKKEAYYTYVHIM